MQVPRSRCLFQATHLVAAFPQACIWAAVLLSAAASQADITWDGEANSHWWFDPQNWDTDGNVNNLLPPTGVNANATATIINGTGAWDQGLGVLYDPALDPSFEDASSLDFPPGYDRDTIWRLYLGRGDTPDPARLTIRGNLDTNDLFGDTRWQIGRNSGLVGVPVDATIVQESGVVVNNFGDIELGSIDANLFGAFGNGTYIYRGGTLEQGMSSIGRFRLSGGGSVGTGGIGTFVMHNPGDDEGGYVRIREFQVAAFGGLISHIPDGVERGVGIVEFHLENGSTRPIQITENLELANGQNSPGHSVPTAVRSSRLRLVLDEAPVVDENGVPLNLGLFDVDSDENNSGAILGSGGQPSSLGVTFSDADAPNPLDPGAAYIEGDVVSAAFGQSTYHWTISYSGNISWVDQDNSVLNSIAGPGSGTDIVLIGLGSDIVPEPSSVCLVLSGAIGLCLFRRRARRMI